MTSIQRLARRCSLAQIHLLGGAGIALTLAAALGAAAPAWARWTHQHELDLALRVAGQRLAASHTRADELKLQLSAAEASEHDMVVTPGDAQAFDHRLLDVAAAAADCGVLIDSIEPGKTIASGTGSDGGHASIAVAARGPYPKLVTWIHAMRQQTPDLAVQTLQITTASDGTCACRLALDWWAPPQQSTQLATAGGETP